MTEIVADMGSLEKTIKKTASPEEAERAAIRELVVAARARGEDLAGPDGLLKTLTKTLLETVLEEEISEHLGYDAHQSASGQVVEELLQASCGGLVSPDFPLPPALME